jgi:hypothetical protein
MPNLEHEFSYNRLPRINVVARSLETGRETELIALIDTGADLTILDEIVATQLGIPLDRVAKQPLRGLGVGVILASIAEIELVLLDEPDLVVRIPVAFVPGVADALDNLIGRDVLEYLDFALSHSTRLGYLGRTQTTI